MRHKYTCFGKETFIEIRVEGQMVMHQEKRKNHKTHIIIFGFLLIVYAFVRWILASQEQYIIRPDSKDYLFNATMPMDWQFFFEPKPAGAALLFRMLNSNFDLIARFQLLLSIIAWSLLAITIARWITIHYWKWISFTAVLVFSLNVDVLAETPVIMSESFSASVFALLLASIINLLIDEQPVYGISFALLGFFWGLTKETNVLLIGGIAVCLLLFGFLIRSKIGLLLMGLFLVLSFVMFRSFSEFGKRWSLPLLNVIAQRILPDEEAHLFFESHGMPITPQLMELSGKWGGSNDFAFVNSPDLRDFQDWYFKDGLDTYYLYLLSHPSKSLGDPIANLPSMLDAPSSNFINPLYFAFTNFGYQIVYLVILSIGIIAIIKNPTDQFLWLILIILLLVIPHTLVVWNGDAMEVQRHALGLRLHSRLGILLSCIYFAEYFIKNIRKNRPEEYTKKSEVSIKDFFSCSKDFLVRGLILLGGFLFTGTLLYDFFVTSEKHLFTFALGKDQISAILASAFILIFGVFLHFRSRKTVKKCE